jgi:hypothetical protein
MQNALPPLAGEWLLKSAWMDKPSVVAIRSRLAAGIGNSISDRATVIM